MSVAAYLRRIGYSGSLRTDLTTLTALHRAHLRAIPFENLDVQLGRPPDMCLETMFDKLVMRGRGGWCYEMNGIFGWALEEIGFDVMRIAGGVMREQAGDQQMGNHLCLIVKIDRDYLADVGFGGALERPIPLQAGDHDCTPFHAGLTNAGDDYWRFSERAHDRPPFSFDFRAEPADEALLAAKCNWQGRDQASNFTMNLVAQQRLGARHVTLRGRVLTETSAASSTRNIVNSAKELTNILKTVFSLSLDMADAETLWPKICARHADLFGSEA